MPKLAIKLWKNDDRKDWQGFLAEYPAYWMSARTRKELVAKLEDLNRKFESGEVTPAFTCERDAGYWAAQPAELQRQAIAQMNRLCCGEDFRERRIEKVLEVVDANGKVVMRWRGKRDTIR